MKKILSAAALSICAFSAFAFEWGGIFSNNTAFKGSSFSSLYIDQTDNLSLWTKIPLTKSGSQYISVQADYKFEYDATPDAELTNYADISLLKYSLTKNLGKQSSINLTAGRYNFIDASKYIFNQQSDGLSLSYSTGTAEVSLYGSYTGFINSKITTMITPETTKYEEKGLDFYSLCPAYVPAVLSASFPGLFANQHLAVQALGVFDLNGDNFNRYYAAAALDGNLVKTLSYSVTTVFGSVNFANVTNFSTVNLRYSPVPSVIIRAEGIYASGNNGFLSSFQGVTSQKSDYSQSEPEYSGLLKASAGITVSIVNKVLASANAAVLFNCETADISYKGFQYSASAAWNIFNDTQLAAGLNQFYGADSAENKTKLFVNLALAF